MNRPTVQAIWSAIGKDDVEEFKKFVTDEHSYRFCMYRLWNQKSEDGIKCRSLIEICCINTAGVPEKGSINILKYLIQRFHHLISVTEVIKCIKMAEIKKRTDAVDILLEFMNADHLNVKGFESVSKKWILRGSSDSTEMTVGYFVSFKSDYVWMSYNSFIHKCQVCPLKNSKLLPVIILSFEDPKKETVSPAFQKPLRLPSDHPKEKNEVKVVYSVKVKNASTGKPASDPPPENLPESI